MIAVVSLALAALVGFAAHRASLCTVRAVSEILSTRRAHILASFLKASLWAVVISLPLLWLAREVVYPPGHTVGAGPLLGGLLFGAGAALNRGCSFSTLSHLVEGCLPYFGTLLGFTLGVSAAPLPAPTPQSPLLAVRPPPPGPLALALLGVAALWGVWEIVRLWRSRAPGAGPLSARYRLSTSALILGVCAGALATLHGGWTHTGALRRLEASPLHLGMIGAVIVGMAVSAGQRGALRIKTGSPRRWAQHLAGGLLMGAGAAAIPGGNGWLVLRAIPSLSPHALPAYGAILAGVAVTLLATGRRYRVECKGDVCR